MRYQPVNVGVFAYIGDGTLNRAWNYIGYDECNYTHSPGGMELLKKFGELGTYYARAHHMLCTGNCHGFYKWGSTNAYTEDDSRNPVYNYAVIDKMCDIWLTYGIKPFFEIGFMPMDLADPREAADKTRYRYDEYRRVGWSMPPKDFGKWHDFIADLVRHLVGRYGEREVLSWYFEMWNEPDIMYWRGTREEFFRLYDYTEAAVHSVLPGVPFGGPATCGDRDPNGRAAAFLREFLLHCRDGINYVTGKKGTRIDFTSFHAKGGGYAFTASAKTEKTPSVKSLLCQVRVGCGIIKECGYGGLPCILSEADPDGWAAGGRFDNPAFGFRNTEYYASYVAAAYRGIYDIGRETGMDIRPLAWAFMFEGERCFEGTRAFSTQGINKPVFNTFRMLSMLGSGSVKLTVDGRRSPLTYAGDWGEGEGPCVDGWATAADDGALTVMLFCHEDTWATGDVCPVTLTIYGLGGQARCGVKHYRIDGQLSNAHAEWLRQGAPDYPQADKYAAIKARDGLELLEPEREMTADNGEITLAFDMPVKSVSLIALKRL